MSSIDDDKCWNTFSTHPTNKKQWVLTNHMVNPLFRKEPKDDVHGDESTNTAGKGNPRIIGLPEER